MSIDLAFIGYGAVVGLSLGLTGSGGSILAIPLLVYGVGMPMQQALVVSLFMVASIAAFGAVKQALKKQVDWRSAIYFSASGMLISPLIVSLSHDISDTVRLNLFALLMLVVAWRMVWRSPQQLQNEVHEHRPASHIRIGIGGGIAGALSGFFGVGGGFIIVPLLTLIFSMPYKRAVGTSLASIAMISSAALVGHVVKGVSLDTDMLFNFVGGGVLGLFSGGLAMNKVSEPTSRLIFAALTAGLAIFMLLDKLYLHQGGAS